MITNVDVVDASLTCMREELGDNVARASGENLGQCMGILMALVIASHINSGQKSRLNKVVEVLESHDGKEKDSDSK